MRRFLCDTNVIVSAILWPDGTPGKVWAIACKQHGFANVTSDEMVSELSDVLSREKFARLLAKRGLTVSTLVGAVRAISEVIALNSDAPTHPCLTAQDNVVLKTALLADVDSIITGDRDFLNARPPISIRVLSPIDALKELQNSADQLH